MGKFLAKNRLHSTQEYVVEHVGSLGPPFPSKDTYYLEVWEDCYDTSDTPFFPRIYIRDHRGGRVDLYVADKPELRAAYKEQVIIKVEAGFFKAV